MITIDFFDKGKEEKELDYKFNDKNIRSDIENINLGIDEEEARDFLSYIRGDIEEPPQQVNQIINGLIPKITMSLGLGVVKNIKRQNTLIDFVERSEEYIFNTETIEDKDPEELKELYNTAVKSLHQLHEFQRKFIVQNKDSFKIDGTEQEKVLTKLLALNPDKLNILLETIMKIEEGDV